MDIATVNIILAYLNTLKRFALTVHVAELDGRSAFFLFRPDTPGRPYLARNSAICPACINGCRHRLYFRRKANLQEF